MFGNFLFNGKYIPFWFICNFNIYAHSLAACALSYMLTLFYNVHQLVIITFNGGLKWSYIIVQTSGSDVGDYLVYNADNFLFILYIWQYLTVTELNRLCQSV